MMKMMMTMMIQLRARSRNNSKGVKVSTDLTCMQEPPQGGFCDYIDNDY